MLPSKSLPERGLIYVERWRNVTGRLGDDLVRPYSGHASSATIRRQAQRLLPDMALDQGKYKNPGRENRVVSLCQGEGRQFESGRPL